MLAETAAAWLACKAVLGAAQARRCRSIEFDLSLTTDGVLVMSHDPVPYAWKQAKGRYLDFDSFVAGLGEQAFDSVNLDIKERSLWRGDGALSRAFARHATALKALDARAEHMVVSSPIPARYEEIARWLRAAGLKGKPGFELADYDLAQARRWNLALSRWEALLLPVGAYFNNLYLRRHAAQIPYLMVQEATARAGGLPAGPTLVCWTRDPVRGPPPPSCRWSQRHVE